MRLGLNLIRLYAVLSAPFIPETSARMLSAMNTLDTSWPDDVAAALNALPAGHEFTVPDVLFAKITDEQARRLANPICRHARLISAILKQRCKGGRVPPFFVVKSCRHPKHLPRLPDTPSTGGDIDKPARCQNNFCDRVPTTYRINKVEN